MKRIILFAVCLLVAGVALSLYSAYKPVASISEEWMDLPISGQSRNIQCGAALSGSIGGTGNSNTTSSTTPSAPVQPVRVAHKECGRGVRITAWVADDGISYQIGDVVSIKVLITAPVTTTFKFDSAKSVLEFEGVSKFEIRAVTVASAPSAVPGRTAHLLTFKLQSFAEMGEPLRFVLDLQYNDPNLKRLQSPALWISTIPTVDASENFFDLELKPVVENRPWSATVLLFLAFGFALPLPAVLLVQLVKQIRPDKLLSPEEKFWSVVDPVLAAEKKTLDAESASIVLSQLKILWDLTAATASEIITSKQDSLNAEVLGFVIDTCDRVSTDQSASLDSAELARLKSALELLVVRPLTL